MPAVDQWNPVAKMQERKVDEAYVKYTEAAAKCEAIWKDAAELQLFGDKVLRTIPNSSKRFGDFKLAMAAKEEAYEAWQREANRHGRMMHPGMNEE